MQLLGRDVGNGRPLFLIAGPCVIEDRSMAVEIAGQLRAVADKHGLFFVFKASFDKANRSSSSAFRGVGMAEGLRILDEVKRQVGVPVLTDVHERTPLGEVAAVVDILQTPAFLVRQTDFIQDVARTLKPMNVKKGQFLAPWDMEHVVAKCREVGNHHVMLCERGASFGYNNLVADMRSLALMRRTGCPIVFDATHAVQLPGAAGDRSGGQRDMVPVLARAAAAVGVAGLFVETHPNPDEALSDGPNMWPLGRMDELLEVVVELDRVAKKRPYAEAATS
jgi:2-dehydro-3-deoxyphosphooctonate aldolase (KDO 8-P synthase)